MKCEVVMHNLVFFRPVKIRGAIESWLAIVETSILGVIKL